MAIQRLAYTANEIDEKLSFVPSLGITGAQPGDIIRVNQVDSEGRPVSLQGGGKWTLLEDLTLEEDTKQVDMAPEGMDQYNELLVEMVFDTTEAITLGGYLGLYPNKMNASAWWLASGRYVYTKQWIGQRWQLHFSRMPGVKYEAIAVQGCMEDMEGSALGSHHLTRTVVTPADQAVSKVIQGSNYPNEMYPYYSTPTLPWHTLSLATFSDFLIAAGSRFRIWGGNKQ